MLWWSITSHEWEKQEQQQWNEQRASRDQPEMALDKLFLDVILTMAVLIYNFHAGKKSCVLVVLVSDLRLICCSSYEMYWTYVKMCRCNSSHLYLFVFLVVVPENDKIFPSCICHLCVIYLLSVCLSVYLSVCHLSFFFFTYSSYLNDIIDTFLCRLFYQIFFSIFLENTYVAYIHLEK